MKRVLRVAIPVAVVAFLTAFLATRYEVIEETRRMYVGYTGEAAANPYYAAGRLLEALGLEVSHLDNPDRPGDPRTSTLLLPRGRAWMREAEQHRLLEWVSQGGRLVFALEQLEEDPLVEALNVETRPGVAHSVTGRMERGEQSLEVSFGSVRQVLQTDSQPRLDWAVTGKSGLFAAQIPHGSGTVVILASADLMSNDSLPEADNARFLWLLADAGNREHARFLALERYPSLLDLALRRAWRVVAAAAVLLAVVVWAAAARLGPVLPDSDEQRRSLAAHLQASGWFLWRTGSAERLLAAARWSAGTGGKRADSSGHKRVTERDLIDTIQKLQRNRGKR